MWVSDAEMRVRVRATAGNRPRIGGTRPRFLSSSSVKGLHEEEGKQPILRSMMSPRDTSVDVHPRNDHLNETRRRRIRGEVSPFGKGWKAI